MTHTTLQEALPALLISFLFTVAMIVAAFSVHALSFLPSTYFCTHNPESCKKINNVKNETSIDALHTFAKDEDESVRAAVARNQNAPPSLLHTLSKDEDESVRAAVARNQNAPPSLLHTLSKDGNPYVRTSVVENGNTSISILHSLSGDKDHQVRLSIAENSRTPIGVLFGLAYDEDVGISDVAADRIITKIFILIPIFPIFIFSILFSFFCKCIEISKQEKGEKTKVWTKMNRIAFVVAMTALLLMVIAHVHAVIGIDTSFHP